jgi:hypothetical protein
VIAAIQAWPTDKIADWRTDWEDGHYVVVVGLSNDRVYVMDPSVRTGYAYLDRNEFLARWHDYDMDGDRRVVWNRLGIVIEGGKPIRRYPRGSEADRVNRRKLSLIHVPHRAVIDGGGADGVSRRKELVSPT